MAGRWSCGSPSTEGYALWCHCVALGGGDPDLDVTAPDYAADYLRDTVGAVLRVFLDKAPQISCSSDKYMATCYRDPASGNFLLHLVNTDRVLARPPEKVGHNYVFSNFTENAAADDKDFYVTFRLPENIRLASCASAFSPEFSSTKQLDCSLLDGLLKITIPGNTFAGYLAVELKQS